MQYAFYLDSSSCSGCKACQAACKDRNGLEAGRLWRRVYEVSGGGWAREGQAWISSVFAYNLSLSCNHCAQPACLEACPAGAISRRPDGIVLIDEAKCLGCGYCAWACPYGAPQYDTRTGRMTKCTFCVEDIQAGRSPACVAACPLRVLEFGDRRELEQRHPESQPAVYPLPDPAITQPGLLVTPHQAARAALAGPARIANREEVHPQEKSPQAKKETPLIAFTLLAQTAAGLFLALAILSVIPGLDRPARGGIFLVAGLLTGLSLLASLFHLGNPRQAYRAVSNLRTSWLSREIFCSAALAGGWVTLAGLRLFAALPARGYSLGFAALALTGLALVYSMARLYRLPASRAWNTWKTPASFSLTTLLLGILGAATILSALRGSSTPSLLQGVCLAAGILLGVEAAYLLVWDTRPAGPEWLRPGLILWSAGALCLVLAGPAQLSPIGTGMAFALALAGEIVGRVQFYRRRQESLVL